MGRVELLIDWREEVPVINIAMDAWRSPHRNVMSLENQSLRQTWDNLGLLWVVSVHTAVEGACITSTT